MITKNTCTILVAKIVILRACEKPKHSFETATRTKPANTERQMLKLGVDIHADSIVAARLMDGQSPQPAQRFNLGALLAWSLFRNRSIKTLGRNRLSLSEGEYT